MLIKIDYLTKKNITKIKFLLMKVIKVQLVMKKLVSTN